MQVALTEAGPPHPSVDASILVLRSALADLDAIRLEHPGRHRLDLACAYLQHAIELLEGVEPDDR